MHAEIVMIGTELLLGELVDTNANRLAKALRDIGLDLYYKTTVGDNEDRITEVLNLALDRSDVVITSGGIGPTVDDVTRQAAANATGRKLVYSAELESQIATRFRRFGRKMADNNRRQAYIPDGALPLPNPVGTAPCFLSEDVRRRGCIISLPGVPRELEYMMENTVIPLLVERMGGMKFTRVRVLRTCAVGESNVDRVIGDLMKTGNPTVGLAAHVGQTDVRIAAKADTEAEANALIDSMEAQLRERLGVAIYGKEKETVSEVVGGLLAKQDLRLGVVDMLTDGQLVHELIEAGFGHLITTDLHPANLSEALKASGLDSRSDLQRADHRTLAMSLAENAAPAGGMGLAMLGPFEENSTFMGLHGPGDFRLFEQSRNYQDTDYIRRWLVIQGMDWIRRVLLGELESPVDWN
ncbi:MAG: CinA family nicotinamide mononucleotide deamidase-related protein [Candidatus Poribacteria bacterium]|nr:CinA family nicotinamide mononucleotide deamidase-related protein [Candidatus Poribacteria bacterium]